MVKYQMIRGDPFGVRISYDGIGLNVEKVTDIKNPVVQVRTSIIYFH